MCVCVCVCVHVCVTVSVSEHTMCSVCIFVLQFFAIVFSFHLLFAVSSQASVLTPRATSPVLQPSLAVSTTH